MKRYRVFTQTFDSRWVILTLDITKPTIQNREMWESHKKETEDNLRAEFGNAQFDAKLKNYIDLGNTPWSILAFHNRFMRQIRTAFVMGAYYPAATGAGALGERILNHLILTLKDDFKTTPEYKDIYRKKSFNDWEKAINILTNWNILLPKAITEFDKLRQCRNTTIHFNKETETNIRSFSLKTIQCLEKIISIQFPSLSEKNHPWFINYPTETYIKKECEKQPFINKIYLPQCHHVGPSHQVTNALRPWQVEDIAYSSEKISDEEFIVRRKAHRKKKD